MKSKVKTQRVHSVIVNLVRAKVGMYWWPLPFDRKGRFIPSSVDCLYNQDYYTEGQSVNMMRSL